MNNIDNEKLAVAPTQDSTLAADIGPVLLDIQEIHAIAAAPDLDNEPEPH